jgi:putative DNA primase/helicase
MSKSKAAGANQSDFTDAVLAERVAREVLAGKFCHTAALGWLHWDGKRWTQCAETEPTEAVRLWVVSKFEEATALMRTEQADAELVKKWLQPLAKGKINAVVALTRGIKSVTAKAEEFDKHPDLLNVDNGVVDLRTGVRTDHDPTLKLTKLAPVEYHQRATHPDWTAALEAVPADVRDWYQVRCGQATTGYMTPDDVLLVQQGGGENGKTTITSAIMETLADYAVLVSDKVILADPSAHTCEKMELRGARFALIEETPEARRLSVDRLKKTVGQPIMEARYVHQNQMKWKASHTLILSTNYKPVVEENDHGTWRRLQLLRFPYTFRKPHEPCNHEQGDRPGDGELRGRLTDSVGPAHAAVLAWLVAGAVRWYADKKALLTPPARVEHDTREWRKESDQVLDFAEECLEYASESHVRVTELLSAFNEWLESHGHKIWSDKLFASRFGEHHEIRSHGVVKKVVRNGLPSCPSCERAEGVRPATTGPASNGWKCACGHVWIAKPTPGGALSWRAVGVFPMAPGGSPRCTERGWA